MLLYEATVQVIPLLLIALFLDSRAGDEATLSPRGRRWMRMQDKAFAVLGTCAFVLSLLIIAGTAPSHRVTDAVVIATLSLAMGLLFARIWRRFDRAHPTSDGP